MKTTEETFIKVSTELRRRTDISPTEKLTISYLLSFQSNNQVCFQTEEEIAFELGMSLITLKRTIKKLVELGICYKEKASIHTGKRQYKNRKAIIVNTFDLDNNIQKDDIIPEPIEKVKENKIIDEITNKLEVELNIGKTVIINNENHIKYWNYILNEKPSVAKNIKSNYTQIVFENELQRYMENDYMWLINNNIEIN